MPATSLDAMTSRIISIALSVDDSRARAAGAPLAFRTPARVRDREVADDAPGRPSTHHDRHQPQINRRTGRPIQPTTYPAVNTAPRRARRRLDNDRASFGRT